jgi:hypothetical protein
MKTSKINGETKPKIVATPKPAATPIIQAWLAMSTQRLLMISASAPAGRANRTIAMLSAAYASATSKADDVSEVMSQLSPTASIKLPMLDTILAIQSALNTVYFKGESPWLTFCSTVDAPHRHTCSTNSIGLVTVLEICYVTIQAVVYFKVFGKDDLAMMFLATYHL